MDYTRLGTSELIVSRIALGCMGFADPARLAPAWTLDQDAASPGAGHDGGRIVFEGTPADLVAARSTLTGEHLAAYVGT